MSSPDENTPLKKEEVVSEVAEVPEQHKSPRDSKGWDGKLRVEKKTAMTNPEAISDPEYSDEENVLPGEEIAADEGMFLQLLQPTQAGLITPPQNSLMITMKTLKRSTASTAASLQSPH